MIGTVGKFVEISSFKNQLLNNSQVKSEFKNVAQVEISMNFSKDRLISVSYDKEKAILYTKIKFQSQYECDLGTFIKE